METGDKMNFFNADFISFLLRTTVIFLTLLVLTRAVGRMQLSEMTFFHYVTGITIGSVAANMISESDDKFWYDFAGLIWWSVLTILLAYLGLKFRIVRLIVDGQPVIIIKNGQLMKKSFQHTKINMEDLCMLLREQKVFSIKEVDYAILEPDGKLSIMKKQQKQEIVREDLDIKTVESMYFPSEVIVDGKIVKKNLKEFNLSEEWLQKELKKKQIYSVKNVLYAELQRDGSLYIEKG